MNEKLNALWDELDVFSADLDALHDLINIVLTEVFMDNNWPMEDKRFRYLQSFDHVLLAAKEQAERLADKATSFCIIVRDLINLQQQSADEAAI